MNVCRLLGYTMGSEINSLRLLFLSSQNIHHCRSNQAVEIVHEKKSQIISDLNRTEVLWRKCKQSGILRSFLYKCFLTNYGSLKYVSDLICLVSHRSNYPDLAFRILLTYKEFVEEKALKSEATLSEKLDILKDVLVYKNCHIVKLVCVMFNINEDINHFKNFIQELLEQEKIVEAAFCIRAVSLQHEYSVEEIVLPLLYEGNAQAVIDYLADNYAKQLDVVMHLDSLLDVNATNSNPLELKTSRKFFRIINSLVSAFKIAPENCKNLHYIRSKGAIRMLVKRRLGQSVTEAVWEDMVMKIVDKNDELKKYLLMVLVGKDDIKTALRMAEKFNISVEYLTEGISDSEQKAKIASFENDDFDEENENVEKECVSEHLAFALKPSDLKLISTKENFLNSIDEIKKYKMLGIDSEWKPQFGLSIDRLSLIQIAAHDKVFIFDILALNRCLECEHWDKFMDDIFANANIIKLGCGIVADVNMILESHRGTKGKSIKFSHILDMAIFYQKLESVYPVEMNADGADNPNPKGLSKLCEIILGKPLKKESRLCDWEERPLKETQLVYAALDAHCLLLMYDTLKEEALKKDINYEHLAKVSMVLTTGLWKPRRKFKKVKNESSLHTKGPIPVQHFKVVVQPELESLGKQLRQVGADVLILQGTDWIHDAVKVSESEGRIIICTLNIHKQLRSRVDEGLCYYVSQAHEKDISVYSLFRHYNVSS